LVGVARRSGDREGHGAGGAAASFQQMSRSGFGMGLVARQRRAGLVKRGSLMALVAMMIVSRWMICGSRLVMVTDLGATARRTAPRHCGRGHALQRQQQHQQPQQQ